MKSIIYLTLILAILSCSNLKDKSEIESSGESSIVNNDTPRVKKTSLSILENDCRNNDIASATKQLSAQFVNYKTDPNYWNLVGACFLNDMKPLKARLFFLRALEEDKNNAAALNNLGVVYWSMDKHYEALAYFKRAEQQDSGAVAVNYNLARIYAWYGLHKSSNQKFSQLSSRELDSQDYNFIGTNQVMLEQYENAVKSFRNARQLDSRQQAVFAVALKRSGSNEDAQSTWKQAKIKDKDPLTWLWISGE